MSARAIPVNSLAAGADADPKNVMTAITIAMLMRPSHIAVTDKSQAKSGVLGAAVSVRGAALLFNPLLWPTELQHS
jgi:hypothetical protein